MRFLKLLILCTVLLVAPACNQDSNSEPGAALLTAPSLATQISDPGVSDPTQTESADPAPSPIPATAATPSPEATPASSLQQLTSGGCCVQPFWSQDGAQVLFIDRPNPDAPSGIWGVDLSGNPPQFVSDKLGIYSPQMDKRAFFESGATVVEDLSTGERWRIPNGGRAVSFSPDGNWLAWTAGQSGPPFDSAQREVWVSLFDGSQARSVYEATGGGFAGWFPDGRLLVSSREGGSDLGQVLWALSLGEDGLGTTTELGRGGRLREISISPDGRWLAYMSSFSPDPNEDGLWLVDTQSGGGDRLEVFGAYQWRDASHLLVVPLDYGQPSHRMVQVDAASGEVQTLTDPAVTPFKISAGDWAVSPDGDKVVFVSADDGNLWLLNLLD